MLSERSIHSIICSMIFRFFIYTFWVQNSPRLPRNSVQRSWTTWCNVSVFLGWITGHPFSMNDHTFLIGFRRVFLHKSSFWVSRNWQYVRHFFIANGTLIIVCYAVASECCLQIQRIVVRIEWPIDLGAPWNVCTKGFLVAENDTSQFVIIPII